MPPEHRRKVEAPPRGTSPFGRGLALGRNRQTKASISCGEEMAVNGNGANQKKKTKIIETEAAKNIQSNLRAQDQKEAVRRRRCRSSSRRSPRRRPPLRPRRNAESLGLFGA